MSVAAGRNSRRHHHTRQVNAIRAYDVFHMLPTGSATIEQVRLSSGGVNGYATAQLHDYM